MADALIAKVAERLTRARPAYAASLRPGVSEAELDAFARQFGLVLPVAFRALYLWRDGSDPEEADTLTGNLIFSPLAEVTEFKELLDGMIGSDFEDPAWWRRGWVPYLHNGAGDHLCLDLGTEDGAPGRVLMFYHDEARRPVRAASFEAWLEGLAM